MAHKHDNKQIEFIAWIFTTNDIYESLYLDGRKRQYTRYKHVHIKIYAFLFILVRLQCTAAGTSARLVIHI